MGVNRSLQDRSDLLAEVAEMYYLRGMNQMEIANQIGVDRSMISRMLSDARKQNIVEIRIHRPLASHANLESELLTKYALKRAYVLVDYSKNQQELLQRLGVAGALVLREYLSPGIVLGLSWGSAVSSVVEAMEVDETYHIRVVQLVGAMGAQNTVYDGPGLVQRLAQKLDCEGYFINAPFIVDKPEVAKALLDNQNVRAAMTLAKKSDIAVLGIGSTNPEYSSFYQAGYVPIEVLNQLRDLGMVGDVCGLHFDIAGETPELDFHTRIVTIGDEDLKSIPIRIGVAGGSGKVQAVLGALRAGYINVLVTDENLAGELTCI